jgi:hypothetical protein
MRAREDGFELEASPGSFGGSRVSRKTVAKVRAILQAHPGKVLRGERGADGTMRYSLASSKSDTRVAFAAPGVSRELRALKADARFRRAVLTGDHPRED